MEQVLTEKILKEIRDRTSDAMAALELLTPLVKEKGREKDLEYLAAIHKSFYRTLRLVRHVEACTARTISEKETLDLAGLYRKLGRDGEDMARLLGAAFECVPPSDSSVISIGDGYLLELAILNLMSNAFEAAGPTGRVTMSGRLENGRWLVTVKDDGPGLPRPEPEEDPFLKASGGVGLGLEAVRRVAELHGGALMQGDNTPGGGAFAVLSIPVRKPEGVTVSSPEDRWGGFFPALVEFSPLLPLEAFPAEDMR